MAYVKHLAIKSTTHISNAVEYIIQEEKTNDELIAGINCDYNKVKDEFELAKNLYDKQNCKIIAHHYIQSFLPGEATPEKANEIGIKFADKIAPGYQAIVVTHIDKNHLHNHIILNSVNIETGYMYKANKDSLKFARSESDKIVKEYGLSIIEKKSGLRSLDQATYNLAIKGQSWKMKMLNSIDEAIAFSKTESEFIGYMNNLGYEVKWQNKNISFRDPNMQKKFIRAKSLASQFGENYSKEGIENRLRRNEIIESNRINKIDKQHDKRAESNESDVRKYNGNTDENFRRNEEIRRRNEYERYEQWKREHEENLQERSDIERSFYKLGQMTKILDIGRNKKKDKDEAKETTMKAMIIAIAILIKARKKNIKLKRSTKTYKLEGVKATIGNTDYMELKNIEGKNKFIKLKKDELIKLENIQVKYAGYVKDDNVIIMTKENEVDKLLDHVGRKYEKQYGNTTYKYIKENSDKIEFRIVDEKLLEELQKKLKVAAFKVKDKKDKYNIAFSNKDLDIYNRILKILKDKLKNIEL